MRYVLAFAALLIICRPSLSADEQVRHDCEYWLLGETDADESRLVKACDRIIKDDSFPPSDRAMAYAERANFSSRDNRPVDAIADYDKSLELEPAHVGRRRDRAFLLYFQKQYDRAISDFDVIIDAKSDGHATFFRGLSYLDKGDDKHGFADLAKGIELAPNDHWYRLQRAKEYAKRGDTDAALGDIDAAIALKNDEVDPYIIRAELNTKKHEVEKAIADLTRAAEINPKYTVPYSNRALLYEQTKQYDLAFADYDKLLSLSPGDAYYTGRKAALLEKLAREPAVVVPAPTHTAVPPPAEAPKEAESRQEPPGAKKAQRATAGTGECRRFDAIANMTISVACPD